MKIYDNLEKLAKKLITNYGIPIIFTPLSKTNSNGGYSGSTTEDTGNNIETIGVPDNVIPREFNLQPFGDAETGHTRVLIKAGVTLVSGTEYKVTWRNKSWKHVDTQDSVVFQVVTLKRLLS